MSDDGILRRIAAALAEGDVLTGLTRRLPPTDLQSLLLHVTRERSARRTPAELLAQFERRAMVQPSAADARTMLELERAAFEAAAAFEAIDLSPVCPLGLNKVLGQIDQNSCLATVRTAEVSADPTTAKALECARRRRAGQTGTLKLCSRSRPLRLQPMPDLPGYFPHFGLFSMVTAGRDRGSFDFEVESLREHIGVYLELFELVGARGFAVSDVAVSVSDTARDERRTRRAEADVLAPLSAAHPRVRFAIDTSREQGRSYYSGLCLSIWAKDAAGQSMNLADGGFTDWTRRLLSNAKERLLVSGVGLELLAKCFRAGGGGANA